jgi:hypothetical protein
VRSEQVAGQYQGRFTAVKLMMVRITIQNTSKGKIADWAGWQGKGAVEDENGNKFQPADLRGWSCLPNNNTFGGGYDGDFGSRIHPGTTYEEALYHEYAPPTSKQVVIRLPLEGKIVTFRGPIGPKAKLDHEKALKAVQGKVLNADDFFKDAKAGKDLNPLYPVGCTMQATGVLRQKQDYTTLRPDRPKDAYMLWVLCEGQPQDKNEGAICYTTDKAIFDKLKVGDRLRCGGP